ncbi:ribosomal protein L11 methyltransferase [mine drainage metagenome]|uniref:Ribosomal protein L11 methyltransferase n=1 Tax=mine drainage metagenome TaxID=410659 RepID=A0A1J5RZ16_9ZZZZ
MNYIQIILPSINEEVNEILIAQLSTLGFDGFEETEKIINAFIEEEHFNEEALRSILNQKNLSYQKQIIKKQNWNQLWESNFNTVIVDDFVGVRADFHEPIVGVEHEIIITPKMSFGTGHHATTFMMMQLMREIDFSNKTVFDFGTGTGILAILAEKLGAAKITAIDNDDWCIENASENILKNNCSNIGISKSDKPSAQEQYQVIIANINKHIILANIQFIDQSIISGGDILLSGLLVDDEADIHSSVQSFGWQYQKTVRKGDWIALHFKKA